MAVEREQWKFDTLCDLYDTLTITQAPECLGCVDLELRGLGLIRVCGFGLKCGALLRVWCSEVWGVVP